MSPTFQDSRYKVNQNCSTIAWLFYFLLMFFPAITKANSEEDLLKARKLLEQSNHILKSNPESGIIWLKEAQFIFKGNGDFTNEVNCILTLAEIHLRLSDYEISYSLLTNAYSKALEHNLIHHQIMALTSLARVSSYMDEVDRALSFVSDGIDLCRQNNFQNQEFYLDALGAYIRLYYKHDFKSQNLKAIQKLVYHLEKSTKKDSMMLMPAYNMLGGAMFYIGNDANAASRNYQKSLEIADLLGDKFRFSLTANNYGEMLAKTGELEKAEIVFRNSFEKAKEVNSKLLVYNGFKHLSYCAEARGDFEMALKLYKSYENLKNEVLNETLIRKTRQIHSLYQLERKGRENDRIKAEQALARKEAESKIKVYQYFVFFTAVILIFLILVYILNRNRLNESISQRAVISEQNAKLQELNTDLWKQRKAAEEAKNEAENAIKSKIDFLSIITHEIRTPLNAVIGTVQLLQEENPPAYQKRSLEILNFSAEHLLNLINDILDYNKIESQKVELERKPFHLANLVKNVKNSLQMRAEEKGIELRLRIDKNLPEAFLGDRLRLSQIFTNLISNAIKFTQKGFVEVEIKYFANNPNQNLEISIRDTGIGIPQEKIKGIFDFFAQADSSITRKFGGSGLGLAITKGLLNLMGTNIQIESEEGKGSRFFFSLHLPVSFSEQFDDHDKPSAVKIADLPPAKILFVEDVDFNRVIAERFFKKWGLHFDSAETGQQAISLARESDFDLILMDLQLPDMSGFASALAIREFPRHRNTPILAMTASTLSEVREEIEKSGINGFIPKPFVAAELKSEILIWLQKKNPKESPKGKSNFERNGEIQV